MDHFENFFEGRSLSDDKKIEQKSADFYDTRPIKIGQYWRPTISAADFYLSCVMGFREEEEWIITRRITRRKITELDFNMFKHVKTTHYKVLLVFYMSPKRLVAHMTGEPCRTLCWKMTEYDARFLWLPVSVSELFERLS